MSDTEQPDQNLSRRRFLWHTAAVAVAAPLGMRLLATPAHAQELPPLSVDHVMAVALAYAEDASSVTHASFKPGSSCANCHFYTGKAGEERGPCTLFPNVSVAAKGWCSAWAPKT